MQFDRLIKLCGSGFLNGSGRFNIAIELRAIVNFLFFECRQSFAHDTSIPMLRAVPLTMRTAASRLLAFKSGIFCLATSSACFKVILATLLRFGSPDPL